MRVMKKVQREAQLPEVIFALQHPRRLAGRLHRRQQQRDQNANDRDHHQQLNQCEAVQHLSKLSRSGCHNPDHHKKAKCQYSKFKTLPGPTPANVINARTKVLTGSHLSFTWYINR